MKEDLYNSNDKKNEHVIKLLQELPRVEAPDNFEYNLNLRIENKNFELKTKESVFSIPWRKSLLPAFGAVAASIILFFSIYTDSDSLENPLQIKPKLRNELQSNVDRLSSKVIDQYNTISENDVIIQKKEKTSSAVNNLQKGKEILAENESKKPNFPFNNSTNLDDALIESNKANISRRASLAGNSAFESSFNGFYIRNEVDRKYVEALKARIDSIKREYRKQQLRGNN